LITSRFHRWVRRFAPPLVDAARFDRHRVGDGWHLDETHVTVAGRWVYLYRGPIRPGHRRVRLHRRDSAAASRAGQVSLSHHATGPPRAHGDLLNQPTVGKPVHPRKQRLLHQQLTRARRGTGGRDDQTAATPVPAHGGLSWTVPVCIP
jgi:hypothetical protein